MTEKESWLLPVVIFSHFGIRLKGLEQTKQLSSWSLQDLHLGLHFTH